MQNFFDNEALKKAQNSNLELLQQLSQTMLSSVEQLTQLQLKAMRAATEDTLTNARKLLAVTDAQSLVELQTSLFNPATQAERLAELNRQAYDVINQAQTEIKQLAGKQVTEGVKAAQETVESFAKNAPAGSEPVVQVMKTAFENANTLFENAQQAAQQVADFAESSLATATQAANQATQNAAKAAAPAAPKKS
ncbi:phasin [Thiopseudomonas alkaliphila]|uniref:TIGR01841 family phasin n=1 Tax=Thiopseudomonas alkaliphila TaxID=1697053 RepID=UPI00069E9F97|nr:TIGR01841 family phasin [Thiopseudomonas alkaliphila]AKX46663.1 phasin [Thiopseudomonas alkaliphila]AKX49767.1 phasin [Thiopseudomonas alkaliphila]